MRPPKLPRCEKKHVMRRIYIQTNRLLKPVGWYCQECGTFQKTQPPIPPNNNQTSQLEAEAASIK